MAQELNIENLDGIQVAEDLPPDADVKNPIVDGYTYPLADFSFKEATNDNLNNEFFESIESLGELVCESNEDQSDSSPAVMPYYGCVDGIDENKLVGWFYSGETFPQLPKIVVRTQAGDKTYECDEFRSDLQNVSINNGYCGFRVPIDLSYGESFSVFSDDMVWELPQNKEFCVSSKNSKREVQKKLSETVDHIYVRSDRQQKKIAVFSTFLPSRTSYSYHRETIENLQQLGYLVILVLPINQDDANSREYNADIYKHADVVIVRENFGYDFGSYATGLNYAIQNYEVEELVFINDSIIGTGSSPDFLNSLADKEFWGVTESFEHNYHVQSYCFGFNVTSAKVMDAVLEFFFGRGYIYSNEKAQVIEFFELAMTNIFRKEGINPVVLLKHEELYKSFASDKYYEQEHFEDYFQYPRQSFQMNVSHFFWRECIKLGFPFIKKELITLNPTGYPHLNAALFDLLPYEKMMQNIRGLC